MTLRVTYHDDRSGNGRQRAKGTLHYGFVYFNDDRRVSYTSAGIGEGSGGWGPISAIHVLVAKRYLETEKLIDSVFED